MRFNLKHKAQDEIVNYELATAYKMSPEMELYTAVVTTSLSNNFYEKANNRLDRIRLLVKQNDPLFVAKLAVYAREKMHLRSIPLVLVSELAKVHNGNDLVSRAIKKVIRRADEITELLAYYQFANERNGTKKLNKLSRQMQKGIAQAFNQFDEYQFAKYNRKAEVTLKDALFITHPKAKDEAQQALFDNIVTDQLQVPYTWETELSKLGQKDFVSESAKKKAFKAKWEELIESQKLGYMALLRNLRNILEAEVDFGYIKQIAQRLGDAKEVRRAKQLPFRFLAAYRELKALRHTDVTILLNALEKAVKISVEHIRGFNENTKVLIASDVSGSMQYNISPKSKILYYDIGLMLSMLLKSKCQRVMSGIFGDTWKVVNMPSGNVLQNVNNLYKLQNTVGFSTNGHLVIRELIKSKTKVDKVLFFTDMQMWNSTSHHDSLQLAWKDYKRAVAPKAKLYLFDLAGYGQLPIKKEMYDVQLIAGWSDKIFDMLHALERGSNAVAEIEEIVV